MLQKKLLVILIFAAVFFINQHYIYACSCAAIPTVLSSFEDADLVVATKVVSLKDEGEYDILGNIESAQMLVEKVYKGNVKIGDELTFGQSYGSSCWRNFNQADIGKKYLFYLEKPSKSHPFWNRGKENLPLMYYVKLCTRSEMINFVYDDLAYLDNIEKLRGKTRISGTLTNYSRNSPNFANYKIKIIGRNKVYKTTTDENGFYEIYDLPAGEYIIKPQKLKGWTIREFFLKYSPSVKDFDISKNQVTIILKEKSHAALDLYFTDETMDW